MGQYDFTFHFTVSQCPYTCTRIFVADAEIPPALEQLNRLKRGKGRYGTHAREAVEWLDNATSVVNGEAVGSVQLQGGFETYESWADVEKFLLPNTLLSMDVEVNEVADLSREMRYRLHTRDNSDIPSLSSEYSVGLQSKTPSSPGSTCSSVAPGLTDGSTGEGSKPMMAAESPHLRVSAGNGASPVAAQEDVGTSVVPLSLRPLFNHVLWRIHQNRGEDPLVDNSFILLTNDPQKQAVAQRFGVRVKRLEQLREAIVREDRDYKNRLQFFRKESEARRVVGSGGDEQRDNRSEDEDEVLLKRPARASHSNSGRQIWDPNAFGRAPQTARARGRGGFRGSAHNHTHSPPENKPGPAPDRLIDPNSFARPPPNFRRSRGGKRRLWEPT